MHTETIEYFDGSQNLIGKLIYDQNSPPKQPAIIVFPAFEGRSAFACDYGKKLAEQGFVAFVADMYGNAKTSDTIEGCFELITPFLQDRSLTRRRSLLAFDALQKQKRVDGNKIGAIGFCFGGMCMLEMVRGGAPLQAGVSVHGVLAKSTLPTHEITTKFLILSGYADPQVPAGPSLEAFAKEMKDAKNHDWIFTFFADAKHSYSDPKTGTFDATKEKEMGREYNKRVAEFTFRYAIDFFKAHM